MQHNTQLMTWRVAAVVVVLTAVFVFLAQYLVGRFFNDIAIEICIFYVPAFASIILYLYFRRRL